MKKLLQLIPIVLASTLFAEEARHPVFQSDFDPTNTVGGTLTLPTDSMAWLTSTPPFGPAEGSALVVYNCCAECTDCIQQEPGDRGIIFSFDDPTNSLATIFHKKVSNGITHHVLDGAIDFFVMSGIETNIPAEQPSGDDCRCIDQGYGPASFRFVIRGRSGTNGLCDIQFIGPATNLVLAGGVHSFYAQTAIPAGKSFLKEARPYHLAVTFHTDADDTITMALWINEGIDAIDTCDLKNAYSFTKFHFDESLFQPSDFLNTLWGSGSMWFGSLEQVTSPEPLFFRRFRIWDETPKSILGLDRNCSDDKSRRFDREK